MRLISAELLNFCQFRYFQTKFAPGLTDIVGRNGSGKSNLMKAVYAALTGDFGRNDGIKTDNICQLATPTAPARLTVVIEHGGSVLEITRGLRPTATRLVVTPVNGGPSTTITKTSEANDSIIDIIGVSGRMLSDYVFVDQWSIFDFLSMMPAERAKAFQRLFRTEQAEILWKALGDHYDRIVIPTPGISKDAVLKRMQENQQKEKELAADYAELVNSVSAQAMISDKQLVVNWERKQTLLQEVIVLRSKCAELTGSITDITADIEVLENRCRILDEYLQSMRERAEQVRSDLAQWHNYSTVECTRNNIKAQLAAIEADINNLREPNRPKDFIGAESDPEYADWWTDYKTRVRRHNAAQHFMQMLSADDPFCPTCGTPRRALNIHREEYENSSAELIKQITDDNRRISISDIYRNSRRAYETRKTELFRNKESLTQQLTQLAELSFPDKSSDTLKEWLAKYTECVTAHQTTSRELARLTATKENKESVLHALQDGVLNPKELELSTLVVLEDEVKAAKIRLEQAEDVLRRKVTCKAELDIVRRSIRDDTFSLKQLEVVEQEATTARAWAEHCLAMRQIVHRDCLPRIVAQNFLELMQDEINTLLIRFDSLFNVTADDNLSFVATFKDGRRIPAARLSGGEKVLLALAFRVVVNDIFAKDLGLLVLDEPTAGLDDGNLGCLKIAIQRLKELSTARGLQLIMITHEKELSHLFDQTIEINKEQI